MSLMFAATGAAQQPAVPPTTSTISVFLDCPNIACDEDYIRTEIVAVNWVRDRSVADVHVLATGQDTGAGGREFTLNFIGLRGFGGVNDTLRFTLPPSFTPEERRVGLVRVLRLGLVRYVARTAAADKITISLGTPVAGAGAQTSTKADPWNAWVFRVGTDGGYEAEELFRAYRFNGRFNANRVTQGWKTQFSANQNYRQREDDITDSTNTVVGKEVTIRRDYFAQFLQVKSLSTHWSGGVRGEFSSSTYQNTKRRFAMMPAIEYNIFPYTQSTRRTFKFQYAVGVNDVTYSDTTIFNKLKETLPLHRLSTSMSLQQPWGNVDININGTQYLHDMTKYRVGSFLGSNLRLFKGFELYMYGGYDIIYDQLSLLKKGATPAEILTQKFQRGTTYYRWAEMGISYTFGSIFNNVVNPRFD
jgi:hypothetical protein